MDCASPTILVVESAPVRNLIGTVLGKEHYPVLLEDTAGGREILQRSEPPIDLLITNEPWWFEPFRPGLRVLYVSGAPDREFLQKHRSDRFGYLQKPFRFQALLEAVRQLLRGGVEPAHDLTSAAVSS